jgi:hypothetical protein
VFARLAHARSGLSVLGRLITGLARDARGGGGKCLKPMLESNRRQPVLNIKSTSEKQMENREAIKRAKDYVIEVFADEGIVDIGLEEIKRDNNDTWDITIGFSRDWQKNRSLTATYTGISSRRSYKTIKIDANDGRVISMEEAEWAKN